MAAFVLALLSCACGSPKPETPPAKVKHHPHHPKTSSSPVFGPEQEPATHYDSENYLLHLSLAELALEANSQDIFSIAGDFNIARAYTTQSHAGPVLQPSIILEYTLKNETTHRFVAIPFTMPHEDTHFPGLNEVMRRLDALSYTVYDLRFVVVTVEPPASLEPQGSDIAAAQQAIDSHLQPLMKKTSAMPPMLQARAWGCSSRNFLWSTITKSQHTLR